MEVAEFRNVLLLSSRPPKTRQPARKSRPIGVWGAGENLQETIERNRDRTSSVMPTPTRNRSFIDENNISNKGTRERFVLDGSIESQCSSPVSSYLLFSNERKYCQVDEKKLSFSEIYWPSEEMDELNEKRETIDLNKPKISLNSSMTETVKTDNLNHIRSSHEPPTKSFSCTELPMKYLKSSSCTDIDGKTLFYNEKGWPVKVMRLTEDSPPKSMKPWPTRSLPMTSCKKSPRKEKSIHTQKKSAVVEKIVRKRSTSSKENKENKKTEPTKKIVIENNSKILNDQSDQREKVGEKTDKVVVDSDLKSMLQKLDQTMDKLTSGNDASQAKVATNLDTKVKKSIDNSQKNSSLERKISHNDIKKDNVINSARSNKYNSKEVKAYMQAKRVERKIQMSEETRKRQDMLEIQKKNLEKLKEKALQVLKKSSAKAVDENKPKWQGPLEDDNSEVLPPAIHIFETKIPTARKSKSSVRPDEISAQTNSEKESLSEKISSREPEKDNQKSEEAEKVYTLNKNENMESKKTNHGLENTRNKLRLSKTKPSIENPPIKIGMEAAAMEIVPQLKLEMESARRSLESQIQPLKLSKDWNFHSLNRETNEITNVPNNSRRTTFMRSSRESDLPLVELPPTFEPPPAISDHMNISPTSGHRKRHQLSPTKTNNLTPKKLCVNSSEGVLNDKVLNPIEDQLRLIQKEILQKQKEEKEPDKLLSHIKPDGFSVMNVMKMKLLANENKYVIKTSMKENRQKKIVTAKNSFDDDTDAPSIISMEEDFRVPEPLRLSDLQLKLDTSEPSSYASQLSPGTSKTSLSSRKNGIDSLKSPSVSSYTLHAPPLVVPESVQNLKLSSNRSYNESSYPSNKVTTSHSGASDPKVSSYSHSSKSLQEKPTFLSNSTSSLSKTSQSRQSDKRNLQEDFSHSELHYEDPRKEVQTIQGSNPAALFLQFHAELSRLDAFDQSLAQVIAAERLHSISAHLHVCRRRNHSPARSSPGLLPGEARLSSHDRTSRSRSPQYSSVYEQLSSEPKASPVSDVSSIRTATSQHERPPSSRSASLHSVAEQTSPVFDVAQSGAKEAPPKLSPHISFSSSIPLSFSPKSIHILQVLIDDAQFQRKQVELMYKTQEDILLSQYKAELSEIDMRYRRDGQLTTTGVETKRIVEEKYNTPLSKLRERRDQALSNSDARIEYLTKQIIWLKKQKKSKAGKPRSAEASPKKLTPLRSISLTSVVENSSSSESSVGLQTFDDKKRQETERDKASKSSRRGIEREMLWKLQEELARVQELEKVDRFLKSSRSRRDKSTSPLESVPETSTKDATCTVNGDEENVSPQATSSSLRTVEEARSTDVYNSESFESPESSETPRQPNVMAKIPLSSKPLVTARPSNKSKVLIKVPLSPRVQVRSKRRGSSGSDESLLLSQNETQSEQSDYEVRISALKEQKRQRFAELNRLERELKRAQREQLKATEAALIKQIQAYELKITQTKKQLEEVTSINIVRPQIKHPRVSDKFFPRTSDVFQKTQIIEELPKPQEQNASDLDTNSLKSVSEASSTETTIQSSGKVAATEPTSKPAVDVDEDSKDLLSVESEVTEALSSVATEGPTVLDIHKSVESEIPDLSEPDVKSVISESGNRSNEAVDWMDAEEFFSQMENTEKVQSNKSKHSVASPKKSASSSSTETNISEELTEEPQDKSKTNSSSHEFRDAEDITATPKTESSINTAKLESDYNEKTPDEEPSLETESPEKDYLCNQVDEGRVISVVSQSPSNKSQISFSEIQNSLNTEIHSASQNSLSSKPESDISQCDDDVNVSIIISEKTDVSEVASQSVEASVATDSNLTSQCYSADEGNDSNTQSDVDENCNSAQSEVIKVFVSNKTQEPKEQPGTDNNNVNLNETFVVSEGETKPDKDEAVVDNITDKILQNLLNECLVCKKDDGETRVSENTAEFDDSGESSPPAAVVESKTQLSVNNFAQSVLNKFLKDATDCMLKIKDAKKSAQIKSISVNYSKENEFLNSDVSSNKLLEALALERISTSSEKGCEGNTPSPKSTRSSNNEVELSEGNESEVFWFDEDLTPVTLQTQREAEELRLKQLQIEQEIEQIKKLEAQESIPYYYLREIPNKPPPPYTPPGQSVQAKDLRPVPKRREDVEKLVATATQELMAVWRRGDDLSAAEPAEEYRSAKIGNRTYNKFLFDLVKQIFINVTSNDGDEKTLPPWKRTGCRMKHLVLPESTEESVSNFVMKKVRILFGFEPDSIKENLIIQWSRKKRDRVDELLVREAQEEERDWTDYSKCEVAVKNNVALSILENLVEETGQALSTALQKKLVYCQQST